MRDDALHFHAQANVGPFLAGGLREGGYHLHRLHVTGFRLEGGDLVLGQAGVAVDVGQHLRRNQPHIDAQLALHRQVRFQAGAILFVDDDDQAGAGEHRRAADLVLEMLEDTQAFLSHARGQAIGIMLANDGPGLAGRARAEKGLLQHHDLAGARRARCQAMLVPMTPPPTMMMSQLTAIEYSILSRKALIKWDNGTTESVGKRFHQAITKVPWLSIRRYCIRILLSFMPILGLQFAIIQGFEWH